MAVGDVTIAMENVAAGASLQVHVATRCKLRFAINADTGHGHTAISSDGNTFYTIAGFGWLDAGESTVNSIGENYLYLPAGYYARITNSYSEARDVAAFVIEY